jgi:hypothetical protein
MLFLKRDLLKDLRDFVLDLIYTVNLLSNIESRKLLLIIAIGSISGYGTF